MKQQELLLLISKYFSRFSEQIKILNSNGEYSINIHAENVLIGILNVIYDTEFENVNYIEGKTYDSIDLRDKSSKYAIQVTATSKITKIKKTLTKYIANGHYKKYQELKVLVLTGRQEKYSQESIEKVLNGKLDFDVNLGVIDFTNIYLKLNEINDLAKILTVKNILEEQFSDHIETIEIFEKITSFQKLCKKIEPILNENHKIFKSFGPNSGQSNSNEELRWDLSLWYKSRRERILPNNQIITNLLNENANLIPQEYKNTIELFLIHVYAFEKHCENPYFDYKQFTFPKQFAEMIYLLVNES